MQDHVSLRVTDSGSVLQRTLTANSNALRSTWSTANGYRAPASNHWHGQIRGLSLSKLMSWNEHFGTTNQLFFSFIATCYLTHELKQVSPNLSLSKSASFSRTRCWTKSYKWCSLISAEALKRWRVILWDTQVRFPTICFSALKSFIHLRPWEKHSTSLPLAPRA